MKLTTKIKNYLFPPKIEVEKPKIITKIYSIDIRILNSIKTVYMTISSNSQYISYINTYIEISCEEIIKQVLSNSRFFKADNGKNYATNEVVCYYEE